MYTFDFCIALRILCLLIIANPLLKISGFKDIHAPLQIGVNDFRRRAVDLIPNAPSVHIRRHS